MISLLTSWERVLERRSSTRRRGPSKTILKIQNSLDVSLLSQWDPRVTNIKLKPLENPLYTKPITMLEEASLEVAFDDIHGTQGFSLPSRPPWDYSLSKEELEAQEQAYFQAWLDGIYSLHPKEQLSFFEHNLEVWRQLWRVCEISQVIVVVADCRHPVLHLPPSLYKYIAEEQGKPICIALTKADIVGEQVCAEWEASLKEKFPLVHIVKCSIYNIDNEHSGPAKRYQDSFGVKELLLKINELSNNVYTGEFNQFALKKFNAPLAHAKPTADLPDDALLTIGFVGHPNAGKSSLINAIMGHKCVSASRTPGHTKHFQTLHLARHIRLCDCPGLVFPMLVPQWLQIVSGLYNIAQVQDPYGPLMRVAQHVNLPKALGIPACDSILSICEGKSYASESTLTICLEYAKQRGFYTAKAARPDIYRAGTQLLIRAECMNICSEFYIAERLRWKDSGILEAHRLLHAASRLHVRAASIHRTG